MTMKVNFKERSPDDPLSVLVEKGFGIDLKVLEDRRNGLSMKYQTSGPS